MNKFNVGFSLGPYCRPAYYLQLCNLRTCAYPLDWQGCFAESALHLYETKFKDFFIQYKEMPELKAECESGLRYVIDTKNKIISMHHIKDDIPLEQAVDDFRKIIIKRYQRLNKNLNKANSILTVCNHNRKLMY